MSSPRHILSAAAVTLLTALAAPAGAQAQSAGCADVDVAASAATAAQVTTAVRCLVNAERTAHGLAALAEEPRLVTAATAYAGSMLTLDFFDHEGPDGSTPGTRVGGLGYTWSTVGENIAFGQQTPREVMTAWMKSDGHCANVLGAGFTQLGVGVAAVDGRTYWVEDFARPLAERAPSATTPAGACPAGGLTTSSASGGSGEGSASTGSGTSAGAGAGDSARNDDAADTAGDTAARLVFHVRRLRAHRLRVTGTLTGAGRQTVRIEVRKGVRRTVRFVRTSGAFAATIRGARGARLTVSVAGVAKRLTIR